MIDDPSVVRLLAEGGAIEVFGRQEADGSWSFLTRMSNLDIADDGNDSVRVGGIRRCHDLSEALPDSYWIRFIPMYVHPELRGWFRSHYDAAVATLPEYQRESHYEFRHHRWQAMFQSTPPDRWSEDDTF